MMQIDEQLALRSIDRDDLGLECIYIYVYVVCSYVSGNINVGSFNYFWHISFNTV